jgi:hypothetical protein
MKHTFYNLSLYPHRSKELKMTFTPPPYTPRPVLAEKAPNMPRLRFYRAPLDGSSPPEPIWLVEGLISAGSVNLFAGDAGSKKTYALLDLALCAALGKAWLGRATRQTNALLLDEESGRERVQRRLFQLFNGHGVKPNHIPPEVWAVSYAGWNFMRPEAGEALLAAIAEKQAGLVIIDALADVMPGGDENSVRDTALVFANLRRAAELSGEAICVIHHANKSGTYRGSSHLKGAVDLLAFVESAPGAETIQFSMPKTRDFAASLFAAAIHFVPPSNPQRVWLDPAEPQKARKSEFKLNDAIRHILRYLRDNGSVARKALLASDMQNHSPGTLKNNVYTLIDLDYVQRVDGGGQGAEAVYGLTDTGKKLAVKVGNRPV